MNIDLRTLISRLDSFCLHLLESAAQLSIARQHSVVLIEHFLYEFVSQQSLGGLADWCEKSNLDLGKIESELEETLAKLPKGGKATPAMSDQFEAVFSKAWTFGSGLVGSRQIEVSHVIYTLLTEPKLAERYLRAAPTLFTLKAGDLRTKIIRDSGVSEASPVADTSKSETSASLHPELDKYTYSLTAAAKDGALDKVTGREKEIQQIIDILLRRRQNNPILTGDAGVGKTAVVEGLASKIVLGGVPPSLINVDLRVLDLALLQAGASMKGAFEERLKGVISEVASTAHPIILFIDEAHQLIGAGGSEGVGDAANILKPALARGELRTIAATTWSEYKKYFEKDSALARRFQLVDIPEPTEFAAIEMLRGMVRSLENHHGVEILNEAVEAAVKLSNRHLPARKLPDKAVSVLDTACSRVCLAQSGTTEVVSQLSEQLSSMFIYRDSVAREEEVGVEVPTPSGLISEKMQQIKLELDQTQSKFEQEHRAVNEIIRLRKAISAMVASDTAGDMFPDKSDLQNQLKRLEKGLEAIRDDSELVPIAVDANVVAEVIEDWTGVPAKKMMVDEIFKVRNIGPELKKRVAGQDEALDIIAEKLRSERAQLSDPYKPTGIFLLAGPSGTGKTETAHALAEVLFEDSEKVITVNMSEFQEAHSVSLLKGAPPGYVGFGTGGVLTEAVRRQPYSVVLLDEIEKAHRDVLDMFYQVFDKGSLDDGEGNTINFSNSVIILTSNFAEKAIYEICRHSPNITSYQLQSELNEGFCNEFGAAFIGRVELLPYKPLSEETLHRIVTLKLNVLKERLRATHETELTWDQAVSKELVIGCRGSSIGAREIERSVSREILPCIADAVLDARINDQKISGLELIYDPTLGAFACVA